MAMGASAMEDATGRAAVAVLNVGRKSEPVAAIRDPPTGVEDWDRGAESPPERQNEVGDQAQQGKYDPEYLLFHPLILDCLRNSEGDEREMAGGFSLEPRTYTKVP